MKNELRAPAVAVIAAAFLLAGCRADFDGLQTLDVAELAAWRDARGDYAVFDANSSKTRERRSRTTPIASRRLPPEWRL